MMRTACGAPPTSPKAQSILRAARTCFERHGFHGASMGAIAGEANISVGHIYRYFPSKDAMIASLVDQDLRAITTEIETLAGSPEEIADVMLEHIQHLRSRMGVALWLEVLAEGARNPAIARLIQDTEHRVQASLQRAAAVALGPHAGSVITREDAQERLSFIGALLRGVQIGAFAEGRPPSPQLLSRVRKLLAETLSEGLGSDQPFDQAISRRTE